MSVKQRSRMLAALLNNSESSWRHESPLNSWITQSLLVATAVGSVLFFATPSAYAVPSYARQTGQSCAACHTAFPELTPFGRQFKLMGYTAGGNRCDDGRAKSDDSQVPLALMAVPTTFSRVKSKDALPDSSGNGEWLQAQYSVFVAGQLYCDVGAFVQTTYDPLGKVFSWDNADIRYAKTGTIQGTNVVYGITANNNPTVQDVWNTTPAWGFPYIASPVAPTPAFGTMLGTGAFAMQVGGVGGYVWINNSIYAEFTAYGNLSPRSLTNLNGGFDDTANRFVGMAPYWRLAYEKNWNKNSLMFGTFGMYAEQKKGTGSTVAGSPDPNNPVSLFASGVTDPTLDIGVDAQYQWIGDVHAVTVRGAYIWEKKKNTAENAALALAGMDLMNASDTLNDLHISATYIYDRTYSLTAGHFNTWGTADVNLYSSAIGSSANGSPNSSGWTADLAYMPFSKGGPEQWPWFNAKIGIQYTHYDKFDGTWTNVDGGGVKAGGYDTVFLYTWLNF